MPDNKWGWTYKQYPLWQFRWCHHCGERIELKRVGSGRILRDHRHRPRLEWGTNLVLRDYTYGRVGEEHTCPGLEREKEALRESNRRLTAWMNRVVREELGR